MYLDNILSDYNLRSTGYIDTLVDLCVDSINTTEYFYRVYHILIEPTYQFSKRWHHRKYFGPNKNTSSAIIEKKMHQDNQPSTNSKTDWLYTNYNRNFFYSDMGNPFTFFSP